MRCKTLVNVLCQFEWPQGGRDSGLCVGGWDKYGVQEEEGDERGGGRGCLFWWLPGRLSDPSPPTRTPPHTHTYISLLHDGSTHALIHPFQNVLNPPPLCILLPQMAHLEPPPPPRLWLAFSRMPSTPQIFSGSGLSVF